MTTAVPDIIERVGHKEVDFNEYVNIREAIDIIQLIRPNANFGVFQQWVYRQNKDDLIVSQKKIFLTKRLVLIYIGKITSHLNEELIELDMSLYIPIEEVCKKLGISNGTANNWIIKETIKSNEFIKIDREKFILKASVPDIAERAGHKEVDINEYVTMSEAMEIIQLIKPNVEYEVFRKWVNTQYKADIILSLKKIFLPKKLVQIYIGKITSHLNGEFISINEIMHEYSLNWKMAKNIINNYLSDVIIVSGESRRILIPLDKWSNFLSNHTFIKKGINTIIPNNSLTFSELMERLKITRPALNKLIEGNEFPNFVSYKKRSHYFSIQDIFEYEKRLLAIIPVPAYTKQNAVDAFCKLVLQYAEEGVLDETTEMFLQFGRLQLNASRGSSQTLKSNAENDLPNTYINLILKSNKEIYKLSSHEIKEIMNNNKTSINVYRKFLQFFRYTCSIKDIEPSEDLFIVTNGKKNDEEKDIYSPEIYNDYYKHSMEIENHLSRAIKSAYYANMWVYTIMHLSDVWRASDIVNHLPAIDLEEVGISVSVK